MKFRCYLLSLLSVLAFNSMAKTVLVVESYHSGYQWDISYKKGLEEILGQEHSLIYFEMDTKRIPESRFQAKADSAWELYQQLLPDLVILADDNALKYLGPRFLHTSTPVVYLGINSNPRNYGVVGSANIFGVLEHPIHARSILMLKELYPIKRVLLLFDSTPTAHITKQDIFKNREYLDVSGVRLEFRLIGSYDEWQHTILESKKNGYDAIFVGLYHSLKDPNGHCVPDITAINWTSDHTPLPTFGFWEFSVGPRKNIGGYVVSGYEEGKLAGKMAQKLLNGEKVKSLPKTGPKGRYVFSQSQLKKWNITLPPHIREQAHFLE